jgi:hypothetical protein
LQLYVKCRQLYPSIESSVIVAFPVNIYATLCEMPTDVQSISIDVGDRALCMKDYVCIANT